MYGLFLYIKSIFFNPSIGATTTAAGRAVIAVAMLTVEAIGNGFRSYILDAHIQLISLSKEHTSELTKKYTLPTDIDVESVLKHMLGEYYDTYYAKTFLRETLNKLTPEELAVVYLRNNYRAFINVPEVRANIEKTYELNKREEGELNEVDRKTFEFVVKEFKTNPEYKKSYMAYYAKSEKFKAITKELKHMSAELLVGYFYYNGDWYDGKYHQTHVEVAETIRREKVPTLDTDSTVTTVFDEVMTLQEDYAHIFDDDDTFIKEVMSAVIATVIYGGAITHSLHRYTAALGVGDDYVHLVEMEEETTMYDLHLTTSKKQYVFNYFIQDGNFNTKVFDVIKIKGLPVIKSDYNKDISSKVKDIFNKRIMVKYDELNFKNIVLDAKELTTTILTMIKSDDYILNKSTVKKSNKSGEELAFGDAKNKMRRLWDRFDLPGSIDFPGSYKEIEVRFTDELLDDLLLKLPNYYIAFEEHAKEIKMFEFYRSVISQSKKMFNGEGKLSWDEVDVIDSGFCRVLKGLASKVKKLDTTQYNEAHAQKMFDTLFYDGVDPAFVKLARKIFNLGPKMIIMDITHEDIIKSIKKIGMPLDTVEVPEFLQMNEYQMVDGEFAATGEFLLGSLVDTLGINCPRNKSKNMMVSSALQTY